MPKKRALGWDDHLQMNAGVSFNYHWSVFKKSD